MASGGEAKNASAAYRLSLTCSSDGVSSRMQQCVVDRISRSSILPFYHFLSSKQCFVHTVYLKTVFHMPFRTNHTQSDTYIIRVLPSHTSAHLSYD